MSWPLFMNHKKLKPNNPVLFNNKLLLKDVSQITKLTLLNLSTLICFVGVEC